MNVFTLFGSISLDSTGVTRGLKEAETQASRTGATIERDLGARLERLQQRLNSVGAGMSLLSAPLVAFGVTAIRTAGDFESAMNRVQGLTRATGEQFERLEGLARELGATTAFSASQAADAMGNLATAGFTVEEIYDALPGVLELAAASGLDLAEASDITARALRGFGLEAGEVGRVNDVMARASSLANTDVRQLGEAFTYVAPIANGLGFEFEETSAAIGLISDAGIQASSAGTGLRAVLTQLITEADDLGIATRDAAGNVLPLADILQQLEERGYTAEEAMLQFGETGGPALTALLARGTDALRNLNTELETSAGTAADLAATRMQGFNGAIANLSSAFEALQIAVADSGLIDFVTDVVKSLTGFITAASELDPAVLRIATVIAAVVAAIGPALLAVGKMVEAFMAARLIVQGVTTAITALRTAALLMAGPAGWIALGVTAVVGLTAAFVANRNSAKNLADEIDETKASLDQNTTAISNATAAAEDLQNRATRLLQPIRDVATAITDSATSTTDLRAKVMEIAGTLDGEARQAFIDFAEAAITSGDDIEEVGRRIADRASRDSLISRVNLLAQDIDENGRQAFINYALEAIATADTQEEAMSRVMSAWAQAQNQAATASLLMAREGIKAQQAVTMLNLNLAYEELQIAASIGNAEREEMLALEQELGKEAAQNTFRYQQLAAVVNDANGYYEAGQNQIQTLTGELQILDEALTANIQAEKDLLRTTGELTRTSQELTESGAKPLAQANRDLAAATNEATAATVEQRDEAQEALAAAAAAAAAADEAIADINRANAEATAGISAAVDAAIEYTAAQSAALQAQSEAAIAYVASVIATTQALIGNLQDFAFDIEGFYENLTSSIENALSDTTDITRNLTRQAELLVDEILGSTEAMLQQADATVATLTEEADDIVSGVLEDLAEGNERIIESANETVTALQGEGAAILAFMQGVFDSTNRLADQIVEDTEDIRQGIEATSAAAADWEPPDYDRFSLSTMELAAETAELTRRKYELGLVTRTDLIAAFDAYAIAIGREMDFVGVQNIAYLDLAERLREVLALKEALTGVKVGGDLPTGIANGIREVLAHFLDNIDYVSQALLGFGNSLISLVETLAANVPLLGDLLSGFSISVNQATNAVSLTFDPFTILAEILTTVIDASEAVRQMFERVMESLQPFIDVVGSVIAIALEPFLDAVVDLLLALQPVITAFVELLGFALEPITQLLADTFKPLIEALTPLFLALFDALRPLIQIAGSLFAAFGSLLTSALQPITWIIQNVLAPVLNGVAAVIRGVYNALATVINTAVAILTLGAVRNLVPLIGSGPTAPPGGFPDLREPLPIEPPPVDTTPLPVAPTPPEEPPPGTPIGGPPAPGVPLEPPGDGGGGGDTGGGGDAGGGGDGNGDAGGGGDQGRDRPIYGPVRPRRPRGGDSIFVPAPTPVAPAPPPTPTPERPVVFDDGALNFATVNQSVQFAVATPLVEASMMMLEAARTLVGAGDPASGLFAPIPPFTAVLERLTPILDRLIVEGVDVNVATTQSASRGITLTNALRPL